MTILTMKYVIKTGVEKKKVGAGPDRKILQKVLKVSEKNRLNINRKKTM